LISYVELRLVNTTYLVNSCLNPNFDDNSSQLWSATGGTLTVSGTQKHSGSWALALTAGGANYSYSYNALSKLTMGSAGEKWAAGAWVRSPRATTVGISVDSYSASGALISSQTTNDSVLANTWTFLETPNVTLPATTCFVGLSVFFTGGSAGEVAYVDDVFLGRNSGSPISDSFTGDSASGGGVTYSWLGTARNSPSVKITETVEILPSFKSLTFDRKWKTDPGVIQFQYPSDEATALGLTSESTVVVRVGFSDLTFIDVERYLIETDQDAKVSDGEAMRSFSGRSGLVFLEDALVYPSNWPVTSPTGHSFPNANVGTLFQILLNRAWNRGTLLNLRSPSFSGTLDSGGNGWATQLTQDLSTGTSYLQVLSDIVSRGIADVVVTPSLELKIYNPDSVGRHVSIDDLEVRPAKTGSEFTVTVNSAESCSSVLIEGDEGATFERVATVNPVSRRKERYVSQGGIKDSGVLNLLADAELALYARVPSEETVALADTGAARPFYDFDISDWVWVRFTGSAAAVERRIYQIAGSVDDAGVVTVGLTLNTILDEEDVKLKRKVESYTGNAGGAYGTSPNSSYDLTIPLPPSGLTVTSGYFTTPDGYYEGAFTANWVAPTVNVDGSPITDLDSYEFSWKYHNADNWSGNIASGTTVVQHSPVTPGSTIKVRVRSKDQSGHFSAWSSEVTETVDSDTTAPSVPSQPTVTGASERIEISWDGQDSNNAAMPSDLHWVEVWWSTVGANFTPGANNTVLAAAILPGGGALNLTSPPHDTVVYVRLVAVDRAGNASAPSVAGSGTKTRLVPEIVAPATSPVLEVLGGVNALHVRWEPLVQASDVDYEVHVSTLAGFTPGPITKMVDTSATSATIKYVRKNLFLPVEGAQGANPLDNYSPVTCSLAWDSSIFAVGATSLRALPTANGSTIATSGKRTTPPSTALMQRARLRSETAGNFRVGITFYDSSDVIIGSTNWSSASALTADTWAVLERSVTSPPNAASSTFSVIQDTGYSSGKFYWADGFELSPQVGGDDLQYDTTYYVKVRGKSGPATSPSYGPWSAEASGQLKRAANNEISANYVYAGNVLADQITAGSLNSSVVVSGQIQTATGGRRVVLDNTGVHLFASDGVTAMVDLPTAANAVSKFSGSLQATDAVVTDGLDMRGVKNRVSAGGVLALQSQLGGSNTPPTLTSDWARSSEGLFIDSYSVGTGYHWGNSGASKVLTRALFNSGWVDFGGNTYAFPTNPDDPDGQPVLAPYGGVTPVYVAADSKTYHVIVGQGYHKPHSARRVFVNVYDLSPMTSGNPPILKSSNLYNGTGIGCNAYSNPTVARYIPKTGDPYDQFATTDLQYDWKIQAKVWKVNSGGTISSVSAKTTSSGLSNPVSSIYGSRFVMGNAQRIMGPGLSGDNRVIIAGTGAGNSSTIQVFDYTSGGFDKLPSWEWPMATGDLGIHMVGSHSDSGTLQIVSTEELQSGTRYPHVYTDIYWSGAETSTLWGGYTWHDSNTNGQQTLSSTATGGTFVLNFNGDNTSSIAYNASAATVLSALVALPGLDTGDVVVTGGPLPTSMVIEFTGVWAGSSNVPLMTVNNSGMTGGTASVAATSLTHETDLSALQSVEFRKRSRLYFSTPALPAPRNGISRMSDDPNRFKPYLKFSSTRPSNSDTVVQSPLPGDLVTTISYGSLATSGTAPPASSDFPDVGTASLKASATGTDSLPKALVTGEGLLHGTVLDIGGGAGLGIDASLTGSAFAQYTAYQNIQANLIAHRPYCRSDYYLGWAWLKTPFYGVNTIGSGGQVSIGMPANGTVISGYGTSSVTATTNGIPLGADTSLYYELPTDGSTGVFKVVGAGAGTHTVRHSWILICSRLTNEVVWHVKHTDSGARFDWTWGYCAPITATIPKDGAQYRGYTGASHTTPNGAQQARVGFNVLGRCTANAASEWTLFVSLAGASGFNIDYQTSHNQNDQYAPMSKYLTATIDVSQVNGGTIQLWVDAMVQASSGSAMSMKSGSYQIEYLA